MKEFPIEPSVNSFYNSPFYQDDEELSPEPPPPGEQLIITELTGVYITTEDGIFLATE